MADDFFGFVTNSTALGVGNVQDFDQDTFVEGIDELNDETFGNADFGDWEEEHERLAGTLKHTAGAAPSAEDDGFIPQSDLEQSIQQLVIEDDENDEYVGKSLNGSYSADSTTQTNAIPVAKKSSHLDDLFGPSSPPGFLTTEHLVSPNNIWGSPVRDEPLIAAKEQGLKNLLQLLQKKPERHSPIGDTAIANSIVETIREPKEPSLPQNAHSLEEIENQLRSTPGRPIAMTVEQLEQELVPSGAPPGIQIDRSPRTPLPVGTPPRMSLLHRSRPPPGHGDGFTDSSSGTPREKIPFPPPGMPGTPPRMNMRPAFADPNQMRFPPPRGPPLNGPYNRPPPDVFHMNRGFPPHLPPGGRFMRPPPRGMDPHGGPRGGMDPQGRPSPHRGGYNQGYNRSPYGQQHAPYHQRNRSEGDYHEDSTPGDPYAHLMTQKEKDWIIKIQLLQIHTDNPHVDDYYYTNWDMKRRRKEKRRNNESDPTLVLPRVAQQENKSYRPVHFEGSLGCLTTSSVHNPRRIIDIKTKEPSMDEDAHAKEVRRYKKLLIIIEHMYDELLDIEDMDKQALALPESARHEVYENKKDKIKQLYNELELSEADSTRFLDICSVRKGIKLIARILTVVPQSDGVRAVSVIMKTLQTFSRKDLMEARKYLYESVDDIISKANLEALVAWMTALQDADNNQIGYFSDSLCDKFGASLLWRIVSRGETIYSTESPVELDVSHQNQWKDFMHWLAKHMSKVVTTQLQAPVQHYPRLPAYFESVVDGRTFAAIEDKLQVLTEDMDKS